MSYPSDLVRTKNWGTEILTDADLEGQFDLIIAWVMASLNGSTGHAHTGGSNDGPKIDVDNLVGVNDITAGGFGVVFDGIGAALATGIAGDFVIPYACTFESVTLIADQTGSIVIDIWKDTYANCPPTVADTITASAKPTISTAAKSQDTTLTGWTKTCAKGDILRFNIDSCTDITKVTVALGIART